VGVHTRQVKGRLLAGIGGGRQAASKIELAFYPLALPGSLSSNLLCPEIPEN